MTFEEEWARCGPWLEAALAHAGRSHELSDVEGMVRRGEATFWPAPASAVVTRIDENPNGRDLLVWLAGGDMDELLRGLRPIIEDYARRRGCRRMLVIGRPGWERAMKTDGYAPVARLIAKELAQ